MDLRASPASFDVLLVMDVVEHVEDCFGFVRSIREKAEYKIVHIPLDMSVSLLVRNRLMDVRKSVGHIHYFSKHTAIALLEDTGYQIIDWFYTPAYQIAPKDPVHRVMAAVRSVTMTVASDITSMMLGGCPLLVLAK